jgi:hypothetical protein
MSESVYQITCHLFPNVCPVEVSLAGMARQAIPLWVAVLFFWVPLLPWVHFLSCGQHPTFRCRSPDHFFSAPKLCTAVSSLGTSSYTTTDSVSTEVVACTVLLCNHIHTEGWKPSANRGPVYTLENFQRCRESCFVGAAIVRGRCLLLIPSGRSVSHLISALYHGNILTEVLSSSEHCFIVCFWGRYPATALHATVLYTTLKKLIDIAISF